MAERLLQLGDIRDIKSSDRIALLFKKIGYNANAKQLAIDDLELPPRSAEAIWNAYIIADHRKGSESLQVLLFQLYSDEWESPSVVSNRMRSLAQSLCKRPSNFLLLGTKDNKNQYNCVTSAANYAGHIWDVKDANGYIGATACVIVTSFIPYYERTKDWTALAWWIHDRIDAYANMTFFPKYAAFNISWHENPEYSKFIYSYVKNPYTDRSGYLTNKGMSNFTLLHEEFYKEFIQELK